MRGKLISIEGPDGCGKFTQAKKLVERLTSEGFPCEMMSFPRYETPTGKVVRSYLNGKFGDPDKVDPKFACRLYAEDRKAAEEDMRKILTKKHLILDRYVESNMGHQGGKETDLKKREEVIKFIEELEYGSLKLPRPDLTIFLYMPYEHTVKLREKRLDIDGHESNIGHLMRAEETYIYLAEKYEWKKVKCTHLGNIRSIEDISKEMYEHVREIIEQ